MDVRDQIQDLVRCRTSLRNDTVRLSSPFQSAIGVQVAGPGWGRVGSAATSALRRRSRMIHAMVTTKVGVIRTEHCALQVVDRTSGLMYMHGGAVASKGKLYNDFWKLEAVGE